MKVLVMLRFKITTSGRKRRRGEEREKCVITSPGLDTFLLDSTGIEMSPELTAFLTSFHVLTPHLLSGEELQHTH